MGKLSNLGFEGCLGKLMRCCCIRLGGGRYGDVHAHIMENTT